jgi:hypothetical protein
VPALIASLVLLMAAAKKKKEKKPIKTGAISGHITNLQQSILETFDIYDDTAGYSDTPLSLLYLPWPPWAAQCK